MWLRIAKEEVDKEFLQCLEARFLNVQGEVETAKPYDTIHVKIAPEAEALILHVMFWTTVANDDTDIVINNEQLQELLTYGAMSVDAAYNYAKTLKKKEPDSHEKNQ